MQTYTINQVEWHENEDGNYCSGDSIAFVWMRVFRECCGRLWHWEMWDTSDEPYKGTGKSPDEAKAAAEAFYLEKLLAGLTPVATEATPGS